MNRYEFRYLPASLRAALARFDRDPDSAARTGAAGTPVPWLTLSRDPLVNVSLIESDDGGDAANYVIGG